jgi:DNA repair exonuclease SbcCD ATPase subunit
MKRQHRRSGHKNKELNEVQELKKENRDLKAEVRTLKKRLKQLERQEHFHENTRLEEEAEQMSFNLEPVQPKCPLCQRPTLKEMNVAGRHWVWCEACEYDTRKRK